MANASTPSALPSHPRSRPNSPLPFTDIWVPATGGDPTLITPARGARRPHFVSTEPDRVYLYSAKGLSSIRFDGSDSPVIMKINGVKRGIEPSPAQDARLSPDGRHVAALASHQIYLFPPPEPGNANLAIDLMKPPVPVKTNHHDWRRLPRLVPG